MLGYSPVNILILPFAVLIPFVKPSPWLNCALTKVQYCIYLLLTFVVFMVINVCLIPFAYVSSMHFKINAILREDCYKGQLLKAQSMIFFFVCGIPILATTALADGFYFWKNSFRTDLKQIVIDTEG